MPYENEIFQIECDEPKGKILRTVWMMTYTPENIRRLWERCSHFPILFRHTVHNSEEFISLFLSTKVGDNGIELTSNGIFYVIDDFVGVYYMTNMIPGQDASVHYSFFDKKHHGRLEMTKTLIRYVFDTFQFRRLSTEIPMYVALKGTKRDNSPVFKFVEDLGFKFEGRKRKCTPYKDDWFDLKLFGLLRDEAR